MRILGAGDMIEELKSISAEIARSHSLHAYEAVDVAWVAVLKVANFCPAIRSTTGCWRS
jgi:hypothetical protein